jgi:hypothetical protein
MNIDKTISTEETKGTKFSAVTMQLEPQMDADKRRWEFGQNWNQ